MRGRVVVAATSLGVAAVASAVWLSRPARPAGPHYQDRQWCRLLAQADSGPGGQFYDGTYIPSASDAAWAAMNTQEWHVSPRLMRAIDAVPAAPPTEPQPSKAAFATAFRRLQRVCRSVGA